MSQLNSYEQKQADKKERLLASAGKSREESSQAYENAKELSGVLPFGQPILIGHHSESRHRRHVEKVQNTYKKSFDL